MFLFWSVLVSFGHFDHFWQLIFFLILWVFWIILGNLGLINWNFQPCLIFQFWHHDSWNDDMTHLKRMSSIKWVFNFDDYNRILKLLFGRHLATYDFENRLSLGMSQVIHDWREAIKGSKELKFSENAF